MSGEMTQEEKLLFEHELKSNKELMYILKVYREIKDEMLTAEEKGDGETDSLLKEEEAIAAKKRALEKWTSVFFKEENQENLKLPRATTNKTNQQVQQIKFVKLLVIAASIAGIIYLGIVFSSPDKKQETS